MILIYVPDFPKYFLEFLIIIQQFKEVVFWNRYQILFYSLEIT